MTIPRRLRSFRVQLTLAGFAAIYVPVLALFGVAYLSEDESVNTVDGVEVVASSSTHDLGWVELAAVLLAPVALGLAWWWAGRAVRPIERIRQVAEHIEVAALDQRIALVEGPTELVRLAASFDSMLDRLHRAASRQREVVDEISHELRTPIAVLVTNADVRLARAEADAGWLRDGLEQSRRTAERMRTVLDQLLVDARGFAHTTDRHPADLMEVVRAVASEQRVVGAVRRIEVTVDGPERVTGTWDTATVARAVTNLLDNAVRLSPDGATVRVRVTDDGTMVSIAVSDDGPGIASEEQDRVFDRAWTGPGSAGRGLGLAIARQVAEAHGGTLTVSSPDPAGAATTFVLTLRRSTAGREPEGEDQEEAARGRGRVSPGT